MNRIIEISFVPNVADDPRNAMAAEYWAATWTLHKENVMPELVMWTNTHKDICAKYGVKSPQRLRKELEALGGWLGYKGLFCRGCGCDLTTDPTPCTTRQAFERFTLRIQMNCRCEPCYHAHEQEEVKRREEERLRLEAQRAEEQRQNAEKRVKLRERFGKEYVKDCPACSAGVLVFKRGKNLGSVFVACSSFPQCEHTEPNPVRLPALNDAEVARARADYENARKCPLCSSRLVVRNGKRGQFIGCMGYPNCKYTENIPVTPPTDEAVAGKFE